VAEETIHMFTIQGLFTRDQDDFLPGKNDVEEAMG